MSEKEAALTAALADMLAGWRYIRQMHGDLYGVGWDRAQEKAERALGLEPGGYPTQAMHDAMKTAPAKKAANRDESA